MLTGYNTDFKCQGKIYHVQTEDGGLNSPSITSLLYHQGAILASRKTSYADIIKADCLEEVVRELMMEQHKQMIRDLMQGKLEIAGAVPAAATSPAPAAQPAPLKAAAPAKSQPPKEEPKEKSLDDIILEFLAQEERGRSQKK
jgi:ribosomal protein L12E/L44/L45/RPP1/RPP2